MVSEKVHLFGQEKNSYILQVKEVRKGGLSLCMDK